jgi:hypothetical protein
MTDQSIEDTKLKLFESWYNRTFANAVASTIRQADCEDSFNAGWQAARQSSQSEPVSETIKKVIRYAFAQIQDFSDADCRDHGFRRSSIDKAQEWINKQYDLAAPQQAIPSEPTEEMKDGARAFLGGLELGIKDFENMASHLELSGAYLPRWFLQSKGHLNKMAKAHYIYEAMLSASHTAPIESDK